MKESAHSYYAFISYRHADNKQPGRQWATWLHQAIETYEVPADLVGTKNERGEIIPERIFPIFRDEEELPIDANLGNAIQRALDGTNLLIVLCSPRAVESQYVADEIDYFKSLGRSNRILAAIIDGEPNTSIDSSKESLGFKASDECFPSPIQWEYDEQHKPTDTRAEPLAADFRININGKAHQGWTNAQAVNQYLKQQNLDKSTASKIASQYKEQQHLMLLKIIAGILGVPLGQLTKRDKEYQLEQARLKTKKLRQWLFAVALLAVLAVGAGIVAYFQKEQADQQKQVAEEQRGIAELNEAKAVEQRDQALLNQSRFLLEQARLANNEADYELAILLGMNAIPGEYGGDRPMPNSLAALRQAVLSMDKQISIRKPEVIRKAVYSADGKHLLVSTDSSILDIYEADSGELFKQLSLEEKVKDYHLDRQGKLLAVAFGYNKLAIYDFPELKLVNQFSSSSPHRFTSNSHSLQFSNENDVLYAAIGKHLQGWDLANSEKVLDIEKDEADFSFIQVSKDKKWLVASEAFKTPIFLYSLNNNQLVKQLEGVFLQQPHTIPFITGDNKSVIYFNDLGTHLLKLESLESNLLAKQTHAVFGRKGQHLLSLPANNQIQGTADEIHAIEALRRAPYLYNIKSQTGVNLNHFTEVAKAKFTDDETKLVTIAYQTAKVWNTKTNRLVKEFQLPFTPAKIELSNDGQWLLAMESRKNYLGAWSIVPNESLQPYDRSANVYSTKLSSSGNYLFLASSEESKSSAIYSIEKNNTIVEFDEACSSPKNVTFSNNDKFAQVVCFDHEQSFILDLETLEQRPLLQKDSIYSLDSIKLSLTGNYSVGFNNFDDKILIQDNFGSNQPILEFKLEKKDRTSRIHIDHNEKLVAVTLRDNSILFIDLRSAKLISRVASNKQIKALEFGPNSDSYFVHHDDNTTGYFKIDNRELIRNFPNNENIERIIYSAKFDQVLLIAKSGQISVWDGPTGAFIYRLATEADGKFYQLSHDGKYLKSASSKPIIVDLESRGIYLESNDLNSYDMGFIGKTDNIAILRPQGVRIIPALGNDLVDKALSKLSPNRRCLTAEEREKFYLPALGTADKKARQCTY